MSEIDLSEKLRQLEAEVDDEIRVQNETRQKIWKEMTGHEDTAAAEAVNNSAGTAAAPISKHASANPSGSEASTASRRITLEDINAPVITRMISHRVKDGHLPSPEAVARVRMKSACGRHFVR